jgi:hypothetical protein
VDYFAEEQEAETMNTGVEVGFDYCYASFYELSGDKKDRTTRPNACRCEN